VASPVASGEFIGLRRAVLTSATILATIGVGFRADPNSSALSQFALPNDVIVSSAPSWDANHDGVYTCEEWKQYLTRIFDDADRDGSSDIDLIEFESIRRPGSPFEKTELMYFDTAPFNGRLSRKEFIDSPSAFFQRFDKNRDCKVTAAEIDDVRARTGKTRDLTRQR
jgi:Ca2+-binding EF-hand superfamily protein